MADHSAFSTNATSTFPQATFQLDHVVPTQQEEHQGKSFTQVESTTNKDFLFCWNTTFSLDDTFTEIFKHSLGAPFDLTFIMSIEVYDSRKFVNVPAEDWGLEIDLAGLASQAITSNWMYLGNLQDQYYYRVFVTGLVSQIPPCSITLLCGPSKAVTFQGTDYQCTATFRYAGTFYATRFQTRATVKAEETLPAPSDPAAGRA